MLDGCLSRVGFGTFQGRKYVGVGSMDHSQYGSRIVYPRMPEPLTESDLAGLFTVSPQEDHWARTVARKGPSLAVLLTHLKVFQHGARFLPIAELPAAG